MAKSMPCNRCGELMKTTLPEGKARCQPCRRIEPQLYGGRPGSIRGGTVTLLTMCPECWQVFETGRRSQKFCGVACARKSQGERQRVRASNDQHQLRCEREKNAPGLGYKARHELLARWKRQGKSCAYCDALATTVDHVVSLVRGGTNYEGNLTPACKKCNSRKAGLLIIEWRTGKRLPRMGRALAWQTWQTRVRVVKVKPPKATHPCRVCHTDTTRNAYCSTDCGLEANNRLTRDRYRASVGLPVDFDAPTKSWGADRFEFSSVA